MLCERCHTREAVIHLTQIRDGAFTTRHFCSECAQAQGAAVVGAPAEPRRESDGSDGPVAR